MARLYDSKLTIDNRPTEETLDFQEIQIAFLKAEVERLTEIIATMASKNEEN